MSLLDVVHTIQLPSAKALAVAIHPDGRLCAAGDRDGVIHVIDIERGEIIRKLRPHNEFVYTLAFHPETGHLFSAGKDKSIREWDIETGDFLIDHAGIYVSAGARTMGAQKLKPTTRSHSMTILSIALERDGLMATGGQDRKVKLWKNGEPVRTYDWHMGPVTCVRFEPEKLVLYSASRDMTIRSWNEETGAVIHKYSGHTTEIIGLEFIDADRFLSVDKRGAVIAWLVEKENMQGVLCDTGRATVCAHRMDDTLLMGLEDGSIVGIPAKFGEKIDKVAPVFDENRHQVDVRCIASHANGTVVSGDNAGKVILWKRS
ncbi:MAG: hypothetical protein IJ165_14215 [Proteobacteria bacterium]|nr:hypothetical protein [Pseudomonadota bacterium]